MALIKRDKPAFISTLERLMGEDLMDRLQSGFSSTQTTIPAVNVREEEDEFEIQVAAPGMEKEDFNIDLDGNLLTISSEREDEVKEGEGEFSRREFSYQSFSRTFTLPENTIDSEKIKAKYKEGILRIKLPKLEHVKGRGSRKIEIF